MQSPNKKVEFTDSQKRALDLGRGKLVVAGAGSGKTTVLAERYVRLLEQPEHSPHSIVALTFSRKAAASLRRKIHESILKREQSIHTNAAMWREYREALPDARINTFHGYCASLVQEWPLEAGVDPDVQVGPEAERHFNDVLSEHLRRLANSGDDDFRTFLRLFGKQDKLIPILRLLQRSRTLRDAVRQAASDPASADRYLCETAKSLYTQYSIGEDPEDQHYDHNTLLDLLNRGLRLLAPIMPDPGEPRTFLTFDELEDAAINLLATNKTVAGIIRSTVSVLLVDEFQDTSSAQWQLVELLAGDKSARVDSSKLFLVGDEKQSIYGFRDANVTVIRRARNFLCGESAEQVEEVLLQDNFRTQPPLLDTLNPILDQLLQLDVNIESDYVAQPQKLEPRRENIERPDGLLETRITTGGDHELQMRNLALRILELTGNHQADSAANINSANTELNGYGYEDIVVLMRARSHLTELEMAFQSLGIPYTIHSGTEFFERQEILDVRNLIAAFADPRDRRALAGTLRGPFFSLPDTAVAALFFRSDDPIQRWRRFQNGKTDQYTSLLDDEDRRSLERAWPLWVRLLESAGVADPAEWLLEALEGIGALAAMGVGRRGHQQVANVHRFLDLVREIAHEEGPSLRALHRRIEEELLLDDASRDREADVSGGRGVQVMTIHASKGLEFPVVMLPLAASAPTKDPDMSTGRLLVPEDDPFGALAQPRLYPLVAGEKNMGPPYTILHDMYHHFSMEEDAAELRRLLYVATTRAMDSLVVFPLIPDANNSLKSFPKSESGLWLRATGIDFDDPENPEVTRQSAMRVHVTHPGDISEDAGRTAFTPPLPPEDIIADSNAAQEVILRRTTADPLLRLPLEEFGRWLANPTDKNTEELLRYRLSSEQEPDVIVDKRIERGVSTNGGIFEWNGNGEPEPSAPGEILRLTGTLFHRAIEYFGPGVSWEKIETWCENKLNVLASKETGKAVQERMQLLTESAGKYTWPSSQWMRPELPVLLKVGPVILRGRIDLAMRFTDQMLAIDLKTNDVEPDKIPDLAASHGYDHQVRLYAHALAKATGLSSSGRLLFFPSGTELNYTIDKDEWERYQLVAVELAKMVG